MVTSKSWNVIVFRLSNPAPDKNESLYPQPKLDVFKKNYLMTKYQLRSKIGQRLQLLLYKKKQNFPKERNKLQKIWLPLFNMTFNKNMDQLVNDLWSIKCWRENI